MKENLNTFDRIYDVVKRIPKGKVATYGQVALLAGNRRWARVVGYALHVNPDPQYIPCHRVVNREGEVSSAFVFGGCNRQIELLAGEGVESEEGRVDLNVYRWQPGIDKAYEVCLFDLDGTLTDPGIGITNSVAYALGKYGIKTGSRSELYKFIGPPLIDSFRRFYGFSDEQAREAVDYYREYYRDRGIFENRVYEGIPDVLGKLSHSGRMLVVATSKPEQFAKQILEHYDLMSYFTFVAGANMDETRTKKDEVIAYALSSCQVTDISKVVMIGDREYDILGAGKFGMDSIGVLFGYGSEEELRKAGATHLAQTETDILKYI
ncbi:MAG: methylated-DNA--[Lachnospiraceae bacterium]|nr:methylated-DNA--[protein]-cysteine S-methyltransferase [Lachnospiraceae bacterium]